MGILNPNKNIVEAINNRLFFTDGYCPCAPNEIGNKEYLCPCKTYKEEDYCCCGLYVKEENK